MKLNEIMLGTIQLYCKENNINFKITFDGIIVGNLNITTTIFDSIYIQKSNLGLVEVKLTLNNFKSTLNHILSVININQLNMET